MKFKASVFPILGILVLSCTPRNPEITEWRGQDRNGIYPGTNLLEEWPEEGPSELWYLEGLGDGYGSPVIRDGNIYITGGLDSTAWLHCISVSGEHLWKVPFGKEWSVNFPGSRSAPTIVDELIYVGSGMGNLYCLKKDNGAVVWSRDLHDDFEGQLPRFGHSESAAVDGDLVFWTPGGKEHNVVALDRFTGEIRWSNPGFGERSAYHPPRVIRHGGRKILFTMSAYHMMGLDVASGELLWSLELDGVPEDKRSPGMGDTHANTILYEDGAIYSVTGDDGNFGQKLELREGVPAPEEVWRNPDFDPYMGGIVKIGNYLYGGGTKKPWLMSVDARSGELADSLRIGRGVVISAGQKLYYYNFGGEVKLVAFEEGAMEEISSFRINRGSKEHFSHPVIHEGVFYLRHGDVLMAFDLRSY